MGLLPAETQDLVRPVLLLAHLLCFAAAAVGTAFCDYALLVKRKLDLPLFQKSTGVVAWALVALWVSGMAVVWVDTGFVLQVILDQPKLLAKLSVVSLLTINGVLLHRWVFPMLLAAARHRGLHSAVPAALGSVSAASWLYAVFLGVAGPLSPHLGYAGFMALYGASVLLAMGVALTLVHPRLDQRFRDTQLVSTAAHRPRSGYRTSDEELARRIAGLAWQRLIDG